MSNYKMYMVDAQRGLVFKLNISDGKYHFCCILKQFKCLDSRIIGYYANQAIGE